MITLRINVGKTQLLIRQHGWLLSGLTLGKPNYWLLAEGEIRENWFKSLKNKYQSCGSGFLKLPGQSYREKFRQPIGKRVCCQQSCWLEEMDDKMSGTSGVEDSDCLSPDYFSETKLTIDLYRILVPKCSQNHKNGTWLKKSFVCKVNKIFKMFNLFLIQWTVLFEFPLGFIIGSELAKCSFRIRNKLFGSKINYSDPK